MNQRGFTLIEMAIVLVVIGLILGMVFKGKQLIDQSRVKSLAAQYNRIIAAMETFHDRYGFYPGDGCGTATPSSPMECTGCPTGTSCNHPRDGIINVNHCGTAGCSTEAQAFWHLLINVTGILDTNDRTTVFGQEWRVWDKPSLGQASWLDMDGGRLADPRIICALDQLIDDGDHRTGDIINDTWGSDPSTHYTSDTDCWSLSGRANPKLRILP